MSDSTLQKYAHIRKEYSKLFEKRYKGIRIYTNEYILKNYLNSFIWHHALLKILCFIELAVTQKKINNNEKTNRNNSKSNAKKRYLFSTWRLQKP